MAKSSTFAACMIDRRKLLLVPAISLGIGSFQYVFDEAPAKAEFADSEYLIGLPSFEYGLVLLISSAFYSNHPRFYQLIAL
jgi:hypothetical protein